MEDVAYSTLYSKKGESQAPSEPLVSPRTSSIPRESVALPPLEDISHIADLYLLYCDSQPLPLFCRDGFLASLQAREAEVLFAILALASRFSLSYQNGDDSNDLVNGYAEVARGLVMKRVSDGPVELSTLQSLCLLSLVDFTSQC